MLPRWCLQRETVPIGETKTHHTSWGYSIVDQLVLKKCPVINMFVWFFPGVPTKNSVCILSSKNHPPMTSGCLSSPVSKFLTNQPQSLKRPSPQRFRLWWKQICPNLGDVKIKPWFGWFGGIDSLLMWFQWVSLDLTHWLVGSEATRYELKLKHMCVSKLWTCMWERASFACPNVSKKSRTGSPGLARNKWIAAV